MPDICPLKSSIDNSHGEIHHSYQGRSHQQESSNLHKVAALANEDITTASNTLSSISHISGNVIGSTQLNDSNRAPNNKVITLGEDHLDLDSLELTSHQSFWQMMQESSDPVFLITKMISQEKNSVVFQSTVNNCSTILYQESHNQPIKDLYNEPTGKLEIYGLMLDDWKSEVQHAFLVDAFDTSLSYNELSETAQIAISVSCPAIADQPEDRLALFHYLGNLIKKHPLTEKHGSFGHDIKLKAKNELASLSRERRQPKLVASSPNFSLRPPDTRS